MLNEALIDSKDREIIKLKIIIDKFKKYDKERKEYYSNSLRRLGELESMFSEIGDDIDKSTLTNKILNQREALAKLNSIVKRSRLLEKYDESEIMNFGSIGELKERINKLESLVKSLRKSNKDLINKLNKYKSGG
jgi:DNA-binding protein H-NS